MKESALLSVTEKEQMARWLSRRATIGGWFLVGLVGFVLTIMFLILLFDDTPPQISSSDEIVAISIPYLIMIGIGVWLLRRRRVIRRWLDEPLGLGYGRILAIRPTANHGYQLKLQIEEYVVMIGYMGKIEWQVGDEIGLVFWENGRFCPRHIEHIIDVAYLPTPERSRRRRRRIAFWVIGYLLLTGIGFIIGFLGR